MYDRNWNPDWQIFSADTVTGTKTICSVHIILHLNNCGHVDFKKNRFTEKRSLQIHMRKHTGERPYSCDFPGCGKRFTQSGILSTHKLTHDDEKKEKCQLCGKLFRQKFHLQLHMKRHEGTKKFFCKQCPFSFLTKSDFDRHCLTHTGN